MMTRRNLLQASAAASLLAPFGGFAVNAAMAQSAPLFRFGIVADP